MARGMDKAMKHFSQCSALIAALVLGGCGVTNTQYIPTSSENPNTTVSPQTGSVSNCPASFSAGNGTASLPYAIFNACDFQLLADPKTDLSGYFQLTQNIDVSKVKVPIGGDFSGVFEGNHHSLMNYSGGGAMFESNAGTIQNLNLTNAIITRPLGTGGGRGAILVGTNNSAGQIINCAVSGQIDNGYYFIGGISGVNSGTVTRSMANVTANGVAGVGGLVGYNTGTISQSFALGKATAQASGVNANDAGAGGLTGTNTGTIQNSFAQVMTWGTDQVGGLVGFNSGVIINAFSSGLVTGVSNLGGLIGFASGGSVTNAFWDQSTSLQASSAGGTGKGSSAMQTQSTFTGWDFSNIWNPPALASYPSLR